MCIPGTPFCFDFVVNCVSLLLSFTIVPLNLLLNRYFHQAQPGAQQLRCHSDRQKTALLKYMFMSVCIFHFSLAKESKERTKTWELCPSHHRFLISTSVFPAHRPVFKLQTLFLMWNFWGQEKETADFRNSKTLNSAQKWEEGLQVLSARENLSK